MLTRWPRGPSTYVIFTLTQDIPVLSPKSIWSLTDQIGTAGCTVLGITGKESHTWKIKDYIEGAVEKINIPLCWVCWHLLSDSYWLFELCNNSQCFWSWVHYCDVSHYQNCVELQFFPRWERFSQGQSLQLRNTCHSWMKKKNLNISLMKVVLCQR